MGCLAVNMHHEKANCQLKLLLTDHYFNLQPHKLIALKLANPTLTNSTTEIKLSLRVTLVHSN
jgi:hypothetical protein